MTRPERPLSLLSASERNAIDLLDADALLAHYENVYASRFVWEGGPEGMPGDWPERMIFRFGLLGTAKAFRRWQLCGGTVGLKGIYGQVLNYFPAADDTSVVPDGWQKAHEGPTVRLRYIPSMEIWPMCDIMAIAWRSMRTNIQNMISPVILQGTIGAELNVKEASEAINGYKPVIYSLDRTSVDAKAVDLGSTDHTESIIKVINDIDCEILARMGIRSAGTEKASGVTAEETLSIAQELRLILENDLAIRRTFCEAVQDRLPGLRCVPAPGLMDPNNEGEEKDDGETPGDDTDKEE